jgi:phage terminase large subunit-like protein
MDKLEKQLLEFPRGKNDDVIDSLQMLYDMYVLQPNTIKRFEMPRIEY